MYTYNKEFGEYNHTVAQILLTALDLQDDQHRQNFENTLNRLLELGALPIINENDSVATEEIEIDNDTMGCVGRNGSRCGSADPAVGYRRTVHC